MSKDPQPPPSFTRETAAEICAALELAEKALAAYYAISPREWTTRFRYDVVGSSQHPALLFPPGSLAQIVLLERPGTGGPPRYRIVLRDLEIQALAARFPLPVVLAYTLAHELVHLVRFASGLAPFELPETERAPEEARVRRIAREALRPALDPPLAEALDRLAGEG